MRESPKSMDGEMPRRSVRHEPKVNGVVARDGEPKIKATVLDLSIDGCQIAGFFRRGEALTIEIEGLGQFKATVRWARLARAGLQFELGATKKSR